MSATETPTLAASVDSAGVHLHQSTPAGSTDLHMPLPAPAHVRKKFFGLGVAAGVAAGVGGLLAYQRWGRPLVDGDADVSIG